MTSDISPRELDRRVSDGLEVTLLWYPQTNRLTVEVYDEVVEQMFEFDVPPQCADDAFHHPYAYAPTAIVLRAAERRAVSLSERGLAPCANHRKRTVTPA
ncbi:hypothetical protein BH18ACT12_BH18ACT12_24190 [soil metagenome]